MKCIFRLSVMLCILLLVSCDKPKSPEEIYETQKSGVVLICNEFYYEIVLPNGESIYFVGLDNGKFVGLTGELDEIEKKPNRLNGTGFFIDEYGKILTNRHVVAPEVDKATVRQNMNAILEYYAFIIEQLQENMNEKYSELQNIADNSLYEDEYGNVYTSMSNNEINSLAEQINQLREEYQEAEEYKQNLRNNLLSENFTIKLHSKFGVAYDKDMVAEWSDLMKNPCKLLRQSADEGTDLALLCLESGETPEGKYIFKIEEETAREDGKLTIDQKLYMIGYNQGVFLANTTHGISAQLTSGTVTQTPDGNRVMYSIPTMQGSSGAPVVNERGRVVAVNFAKAKGSDNFNFGIPMDRILLFLK